MSRTKRFLAIFLPTLAIGVSTCFFFGCELWRLTPVADTVQAEVDAAIDHDLDGIIVCVNQGGTSSLYAAGWHDRDQEIPADPQALFKIASISKLYIAAATAKLVQAGRLSLEQTVADYLPELAPRIEHADAITLRMLVQHRSGIPRFIDHPDFPWGDLPVSNREALELVLDEPANFRPDRRHQYANTNYLLIGAILDSTLGYSHRQYIQEEMLAPLDLNRTYHLLREVPSDEVMSGYMVDWEDDVKGMDYTIPGGSMVASAEEVAEFLRALIDGTLFTEAEQALYSSLYTYEHTGELPGYQSIARYHEDLDAVVVLFINTSGGNSWSTAEIVYKRLLKVLRG